jgi:hypothetical protein
VLYSADTFEPLTAEAWNEARVRDAIRAIVADADAACRGPRLLWKADPWDGWRSTSPMKNLYVGAAGVIWALDRLRARGYAETRLDLSRAGHQHPRAGDPLRPDYMRGVEAARAASVGARLRRDGHRLRSVEAHPGGCAR